MCGIIGACALNRNITPMISLGLRRLEYRGYDSVGLAIISGDGLVIRKAKGDVDSFLSRFKVEELSGFTGLGHTRWATHGPPSDVNAHPHTDCSGRIAIVHNGVIRNWNSLKRVLELRGHRIVSETDTELIAHLIEDETPFSSSFFEAFVRAVSRLEGGYAIAVVNADEPNRVYFARMKSPLVVGLGDGFNIVASDIPALLDGTRRILLIEDGELGWVTPTEVKLFKLTELGLVSVEDKDLELRVRVVEWGVEEASKQGYPYFMLKEIVEQPYSIKSTYEGNVEDPTLRLAASLVWSSRNIIVTGAGTSYHAGLIFSYYLSRMPRLISHNIIASEYKLVEEAVGEGDIVIAISQSGETYDTLEAVRAFKARGARIVGVTNVIGSALSRESDIVIYMRAGPEIGVAATKTYTSQIMSLTLLTLFTALEGGVLDYSEVRSKLEKLSGAHEIVARAIEKSLNHEIDLSLESKSAYILGRGLGSLIAREAALKIKEIAYIHAESYPAGESKHGPIALVEKGFPVYFIATSDSPEIEGNVMEMKARGARVVVVKTDSWNLDVEPEDTVKIIEMPLGENEILLEPYPLIPYFQILAYKISVAKGHNPDKPRNLAKTVTVE